MVGVACVSLEAICAGRPYVVYKYPYQYLIDPADHGLTTYRASSSYTCAVLRLIRKF